MAKRYYNLEKETKAYLKACDDRNIIPLASVKQANDFCIAQKNIGWSMTPLQLIEYSFVPNIWLDSTISASYPSIRTSWINMINREQNAALPSTVLYNSSRGGSLFLNNSQAGSILWNANGITSDFTIDSWITFLSGSGTNISLMFGNDVYQTRGFRSGFNPTNRSYNFWNSESLPSGTANAFFLNTPTNSITYGVPINITLSFNTTTGVASIFLNGSLSVASPANRTFIPPTNSSIVFNGNLNATNQSILLHNIKIYNKALTTSQVNTTYNLLRGRFGL